MNWFKKLGVWTKAAIAFAGIILLAIWGAIGRRRAEKTGEEIGRLEESKERLNEAERKGDDAGVLTEFRRQTRPRRKR